jgi:dihydrodipicolinate reductase
VISKKLPLAAAKASSAHVAEKKSPFYRSEPDIVGEHTVIVGGTGEHLEFIHRAHRRDTFARGAPRPAEWLANKRPGPIRDVLGL